MDKKLTIVVPAYNEEGTIEKTVSEVHSCAACCLEAFEVIIVDDGSHDRTGDLAYELASTLS
ncbi:MAG: glycosyltransferase, partial [Nitrososphaera sp.]